MTPGIVEIVLTNILYDYNDDKITSMAERDLLYLRGLLDKYPHITIELGSHTDSRGDPAYNLELSQIVQFLYLNQNHKTHIESFHQQK